MSSPCPRLKNCASQFWRRLLNTTRKHMLPGHLFRARVRVQLCRAGLRCPRNSEHGERRPGLLAYGRTSCPEIRAEAWPILGRSRGRARQLRLLCQPGGNDHALLPKTLATRLQPGDEVIVPAASFPTTVNPIIQNGLTPVFVDSCLGDYNLDPDTARSSAIFAHACPDFRPYVGQSGRYGCHHGFRARSRTLFD